MAARSVAGSPKSPLKRKATQDTKTHKLRRCLKFSASEWAADKPAFQEIQTRVSGCGPRPRSAAETGKNGGVPCRVTREGSRAGWVSITCHRERPNLASKFLDTLQRNHPPGLRRLGYILAAAVTPLSQQCLTDERSKICSR